MAEYLVRHRTTYRYVQDVSHSWHLAHLKLRSTPAQVTRAFRAGVMAAMVMMTRLDCVIVTGGGPGLMQAANDYNLGPSNPLGPIIDAKGFPNRHMIFPVHGDQPVRVQSLQCPVKRPGPQRHAVA